MSHWMALRENGTVMIWWTAYVYIPLNIYYVSDERLENIIAIGEGKGSPYTSMALTSSGSVLSWVELWNGRNELIVPEELE